MLINPVCHWYWETGKGKPVQACQSWQQSAEETSQHGRVVWSEKWAVRFGQNKTRHGLHFENEATHLALLREAGFDQIDIRQDAGLGSNALMVAMKAGGSIT